MQFNREFSLSIIKNEPSHVRRRLLPGLKEFVDTNETNIQCESYFVQAYMDALANIAHIYIESQESCNAIPLLQKLLEMQEIHYGTEHHSLIKTLSSLGVALKNQNMLERAIRIAKSSWISNDVRLSFLLGDLAMLIPQDCEEQFSLLNESLNIKLQYFDPTHVEIGIAFGNLSTVYANCHDYDKEIELLNRTLSIFDAHFQCDDYNVALAHHKLSIAHTNKSNHVLQRLGRNPQTHEFSHAHFDDPTWK